MYDHYRGDSETLPDERVAQNDQAIRQGKQILFEGAQGTRLDIDHGTANPVSPPPTPISGAACSGAGVGPDKLHHILGVKAYTTRVGAGPFPTELTDETGNYMQERG